MYGDDDDKILRVGSENEETLDDESELGEEIGFGTLGLEEEDLLTADPYETADEL